MAVTPYLARLVWGGTIYDNTTGGNAVEVWSNSLAVFVSASGDTPSVMVSSMYTPLASWIARATTRVSPTVALEYVKFNAIDPETGLQITDPTAVYYPGTPPRGAGGTAVPALTTSYKITIDNGTRNGRARGGFYVPRSNATIDANGRWNSGSLSGMVSSAATLFVDLKLIAGVGIGVYSRTGHEYYGANRFRIGNVPDNISTRKNDLTEVYSAGVV